jgi:phage-related baseplate assembly protein
MAGAYSQVDLSQLAPPDVVEQLEFEAIKAAMLADLQARDSTFTALVESDPAYKVIEVCAYRELLVRQRVNDAAQAVMLAYATGADLDQIAANYGVQRLLITPADDTVVPPIVAEYETDADLRVRVTLSLEGYTCAGSEGSYVFHALSADGDVRDASAVSPDPGEVVVYVLARDGDGTASPELIAAVESALNAEKVRPMTDQVTVQSASIVDYTIAAELVVYPGPDAAVVVALAQVAAQDYADAQHRMGYDVTLSGVYAALHQPGVQRVNLSAPAANLVIGDGEAAYCTSIALTVAALPGV